MKLEEIKTAVESGKKVLWISDLYEVRKDKNGEFLVVCIPNGKTLNGREDEFFIA